MKISLFARILLFFVLPAHVILLLTAWIFHGCSEGEFEEAEITSVELVNTISPSLEAPPALPEPDTEPEPEPPPPEDFPAVEEPDAPKLITRKIPRQKTLPPSDLQKRMRDRLDKVKDDTPRRRSPASSGKITTDKSSNWYNSYLQRQMHGLWRQPSRSVVKKETAVTKIGFRIYRDGHIENIRILRSSGNRIMDDSVLAAVKMADPLLPPSDIDGRYGEYELLFELKPQTN